MKPLLELSEREMNRLMLGSLVFNIRTGEIVKIESLSTAYIEGPTKKHKRKYAGQINGLPYQDFHSLEVTVPLLAALGWEIEDYVQAGVVTAWAPTRGDYPEMDAGGFKVKFCLVDGAIEGYSAGHVIIERVKNQWVELVHFNDLEHHFIRAWSARMPINFIEEKYKIPV